MKRIRVTDYCPYSLKQLYKKCNVAYEIAFEKVNYRILCYEEECLMSEKKSAKTKNKSGKEDIMLMSDLKYRAKCPGCQNKLDLLEVPYGYYWKCKNCGFSVSRKKYNWTLIRDDLNIMAMTNWPTRVYPLRMGSKIVKGRFAYDKETNKVKVIPEPEAI